MANYDHLSDEQILALAKGEAAPTDNYAHLSDEEIMRLAQPSSFLKDAGQAAIGIPVDLATGLASLIKKTGDPRGASYFRERAAEKGKTLYAPEKVGDFRELAGLPEANWAQQLTQDIGEALPFIIGGEAALPARFMAQGLGKAAARYGAEGGFMGETLSNGDPIERLKSLGLGTGLGALTPVIGKGAEMAFRPLKKGVNAISEWSGKKPIFNISPDAPLTKNQIARLDARGASGAPMTAAELESRIALAEGKGIPSAEMLNSERLKKRQEFLTRVPFSGASKPYAQFEGYLNTEKNKIIEDLSQKAAQKEIAQEALDAGLTKADEVADVANKVFEPENYLKSIESLKTKFKSQLDKKVGTQVYKKLNNFLEAAPVDAPKNFQDSQAMRNVVNEIYQDAAVSGDKKLQGALIDVNRAIDKDIAKNAKQIDTEKGLSIPKLLEDRNARFKDDLALNKLLGKSNPEELTLKDFIKNYQSVATKNKGQDAESLFRETNAPLSKLVKESKLIPNITKSNYMKPPIKEHVIPLLTELGLMGSAYGVGHYFNSPTLGGMAAIGIPLLARSRARYLNSPRFAQRYLAGLEGKTLEAEQPALTQLMSGGLISEFNQ